MSKRGVTDRYWVDAVVTKRSRPDVFKRERVGTAERFVGGAIVVSMTQLPLVGLTGQFVLTPIERLKPETKKEARVHIARRTDPHVGVCGRGKNKPLPMAQLTNDESKATCQTCLDGVKGA